MDAFETVINQLVDLSYDEKMRVMVTIASLLTSDMAKVNRTERKRLHQITLEFLETIQKFFISVEEKLSQFDEHSE